jgi:CheY-like chemotaxis protein
MDQAQAARGARNPPLRILVVDDNRDAAILMGRLLGILGNDVRVVHDGFAALEAAEQFRPEAVLLDIGLPQMDGYETARLMREMPICKDITIIAVTGWGQEEDREKSRLAGFNHHVVKPADSSTLTALLATVRPNAAAFA